MTDLLVRVGGAGRGDIQLYDAYSTSFLSGDENPIVEDGLWDNGAAVGTSWKNMRVVGGKLFGTQTGSKPPYDDSGAIRRARPGRIWHPDQDVRARIAFDSSRPGWNSGGFHELELHLRATISAGSFVTYEVVFSMNDGTTYCEITQWLGPFAATAPEGATSFVNLKRNASFTAPANGTWVRATIIGNIIRAYTSPDNAIWTESITAHDITTPAVNGSTPTPILTGSPGAGHWKNDTADVSSTYAFDRFIAQRALAA